MGAEENDPLKLLPIGTTGSLALHGEAFKLAFTPGLLAQVFRRDSQSLLPNPTDVLSSGEGGDKGGYLPSQHFKEKGIFPDADPDNHWWIPTGRAFMSSGEADTALKELDYATQHFFLPPQIP